MDDTIFADIVIAKRQAEKSYLENPSDKTLDAWNQLAKLYQVLLSERQLEQAKQNVTL